MHNIKILFISNKLFICNSIYNIDAIHQCLFGCLVKLSPNYSDGSSHFSFGCTTKVIFKYFYGVKIGSST